MYRKSYKIQFFLTNIICLICILGILISSYFNKDVLILSLFLLIIYLLISQILIIKDIFFDFTRNNYTYLKRIIMILLFGVMIISFVTGYGYGKENIIFRFFSSNIANLIIYMSIPISILILNISGYIYLKESKVIEWKYD